MTTEEMTTEEMTAEEMTAEELSIEEILRRQQEAFRRDGIPDAKTRSNRIERLKALLLDHADELAQALNDDFGTRPEEFSAVADIVGNLAELSYLQQNLAKWMRPQRPARLAGWLGFTQEIQAVPLGVVGVIGPWNFPLQLVIQPAAAALAAGNRVMMRPSSVTAKMTDVLARYAPDYFDVTELAVITSRHGSGSAFSKLRLDHIFFTGSPEVGAQVAEAAGRNLVPVTLELGGKNPAVVDRGAPLGRAAQRIAASRMINSGQVCLSPDYAYVPEEDVDHFVELVLDQWRSMFPDMAGNRQYTSVVNDKNYERIVGLIDQAVEAGATKRQAVPPSEAALDAPARKIAPTVLTGVTKDMRVAQEEIFGPVLVVYGYGDVQEAIDHVATGESPLGLYWYGDENARYRRMFNGTRSGGVNRNDFGLVNASPKLPFGGVGYSGMGNYHGEFGFRTLSHQRSVAASRLPVSLAKVMAPPYRSAFIKGIGFELRRQRAATRKKLR